MKLRSTCWSNRQLVAFDIRDVECYKLPVASTCCLLPFDMSKQHVERCFDMLLVWTGLYRLPLWGLKRTLICRCLIPHCCAVFIIIISSSFHTSDFFTYLSHSIFSHITPVWMNFPRTIRTNKIVKRAIMLFICIIKTIVGSPVFWNKFGEPITTVMEILMQNHKCNEVENAFPIYKVSRESPCKGAHGFTSQWS